MAKFRIPKSFINQLKEFSNGGYCLFIINSEGGIDIYPCFDNEVSAASLITKIANVGTAMAVFLERNEMKDILGESDPD